jgi:hypothetical protein
MASGVSPTPRPNGTSSTALVIVSQLRNRFYHLCRSSQEAGGQPQLPACGFSRRLRLDRERMDGALKFRGKRRIYHTMALDPALPFEGRRYDIDPEMRLAARPVARMALMQMRFVRNVEAFR